MKILEGHPGLRFPMSTITGGAGYDYLEGTAADDIIYGLAGNDSLNGGPGTDVLDGGDGVDTASFDIQGPDGDVTVNLILGTSSGTIIGNDTLVSIENVFTGSGNDTIIGNDASNTLTGDNGSNTISANGGDDVVRDWGHASVLDGGSGDDLLELNRTDYAPFTLTFIPGVSNTLDDGTTYQNFETLWLQTGAGDDHIVFYAPRAASNWWLAHGGNDTVTVVASNYAARIFFDGNLDGGFGGDERAGSVTLNSFTGARLLGLNEVENYEIVGGASNDQFVGAGGKDVFTGGEGNDVLDGGGGVDTAIFASARSLYTVTNNQDGSYTVSGDGVDTLRRIEKLQFADQTMDIGPAKQSDFGGGGQTDVVFQRGDGRVAMWSLAGVPGFVMVVVNTTISNPGAFWHIKAAGDFDADGKSDILWQNDSGQAAIWFMNGSQMLPASSGLPNPGAFWHVKASGDFNGDGRADILWQNDSGQAAIWLMNGTTVLPASSGLSNPGPSWHVITSADFNGDGKSDILWQNDSGQAAIWLMDGTAVLPRSVGLENVGSSWHVRTAGDFNGDGDADIAWQHDDGRVALWFMRGAVQRIGSGLVVDNPGLSWRLFEAADYDNDGKADLLWQNDSRQVAAWFMNGLDILPGSGIVGNPGAGWQAIAG